MHSADGDEYVDPDRDPYFGLDCVSKCAAKEFGTFMLHFPCDQAND